MRESGAALAIAAICQSTHGLADGALHVIRIFRHVREYFFKRDRVVLRVPAIVIGDQGEGSVAKFGFASELGFGYTGHSNYVKTELAVGVRFGERGKLRSFHAD